MYFAVEDYNKAELIIANGYLSYVLFEHHATTGFHKSQEYGQLCRENLEAGISQLSLILPATMEIVAALTLGVSLHIAPELKYDG